MELEFPLSSETELTKETLVSAAGVLIAQKFASDIVAKQWVADHKLGKFPLSSNNKPALVGILNEMAMLEDYVPPESTDSKTPKVKLILDNSTIANELGVRDLTVYRDAPVEVRREGTTSIMETRTVEVTERTTQPVLTQDEVRRLGVCKWHKYKLDPNFYTTVVNGRRFMLNISDFQPLKDQGLVIEVGPDGR